MTFITFWQVLSLQVEIYFIKTDALNFSVNAVVILVFFWSKRGFSEQMIWNSIVKTDALNLSVNTVLEYYYVYWQI